MPLVNEVVIGLPDKDKFNGSQAEGRRRSSRPTSPTRRCRRWSRSRSATPGIAPTNFPRTDLVTTFLTGITGVNQPKAQRVERGRSEMLRLNTAIPPTP